MSESKTPLLMCPVCGQGGFYERGLKTHHCRSKPLVNGKRQRLTPEEIQRAVEVARSLQGAPASCDIECPRCHRISFAWERNYSCPECHWTIRPNHVEHPYGYDVLIELRTATITTTTDARHYKGSEATAKRRARCIPGFVRVLATVPVGEREWLAAYGEGRM